MDSRADGDEPMDTAIVAKHLVKRFGEILALDDLSFNVNKGEIFGLIGPNGAGKTTALRIVGTLIKPTSGNVNVFNIDVVKEPSRVRGMISYLPEEAGAYGNLSGIEYLRFMASFYRGERSDVEEIAKEGARISGLGGRLEDRVKGYSKGMNRRILVARALMVMPQLAILDEPTAGLDVVHALHIRHTIREYPKKYQTTVLLSSHNMLEVDYLCDRVALIDKGRIVAEGRPEELKAEYGAENLEEVFMEATRVA